MRACRVHFGGRAALGVVATMLMAFQPGLALDKPTGAPLALSTTETEQSIPLAILAPDGKTASLVTIRLHWNPKTDVAANEDATQFEIDLPTTNPGASAFTAQLWHASFAGAMAWQQPWEGAQWKVLQTPATDGSGIDAALAVGMISTSARRPYPKETVVIASLNPDGSLGPVSHLSERMDAAAKAGMKRVVICSGQRFDTDADGGVVNEVRHAGDLHMECAPVDDLVDATETTMNDPLPDAPIDASTPKYNNEVASYIDDFAHREQTELESGLKFAPKKEEIAKYPPRQAAIWTGIFADNDSAQQAYRAGQVYVAYQLFAHANSQLHGLNALAGQNKITFDVKAALSDSDALRQKLHDLMNPPAIDRGELQSAVLVAEMSDWAYDVNADLEGAQLVTKQTFSQRSDATEAEKDRAREAIIFAIEQGKYLMSASAFYTGLLPHIGKDNPLPVDTNAAHLLPQLIPAQLATARLFTEGIRPRANDLRDGLLFDPRLVAYVNVLRETKAEWDALQHKREMEEQEAAAKPTPPPTTPSTNAPSSAPPTKLDAGTTEPVGFDPGNTYRPPHTVMTAATPEKKLSDVALCLIWANTDCEIATLQEKYLRLAGTIDPATREWHVKDRSKLDALLQEAEIGARRGITFAGKAEVDPSVLAMIYERGAHLRIQGDDASALQALRQYWRCALLGNLCWQLAHARKAQPVDLATTPAAAGDDKTPKDGDKKPDDKKPDDKTAANATDKDKKPDAAANDKDKKPEVVADKDKKPATVPDTTPQPTPEAVNHDVLVVNPPPTPVPPAPPNAAAVVVPPPASPVVLPAPTETPQPPPRALPVIVEATPNPTPAPTVVETTPSPTPPPAVVETTPNPTPVPVAPPSPVITPPPAAPAVNAADDDANIPVAHVAKPEDLNGGGAPTTNAAPIVGPQPPPSPPPPPVNDNGDGHAGAFP